MLETGRMTIVMGTWPGRDGFLSIGISPGGKYFSYDVTLHFVSLAREATSANPGPRGSWEMKTKAKILSSFLLLSLIIMAPLTVRAKIAAPM
jgi:hypothetical protein